MESYEKQYFDEILKILKEKKLSKQEISKLKIKLCRKYHISIPTDIKILLSADVKDRKLLKHLITKPTRTISGVAVCAIMTKPIKCPHGKCAICPGGPKSAFGNIPQSYTGKEPATRRALRNDFDPYLQVMNRLEQYVMIGQIPEKIELIIMGGTFPSFKLDYQEEVIKYALKAMNDFSSYFFRKNELNLKRFKEFFEMPGNFQDDKRVNRIKKKLLKLKNKTTLEKEQKKNESSKIRCVGMTIETRPDYAKLEHANQMLRLGATRVELGVQTVYDDVLEKIERGHSVRESIEATRVLKNLGFKINYHMMPGLPGSDKTKDINAFKKLFENPDFKPDMLKIYPCMVLKGTKVYTWWKDKQYNPITTKDAVEIISEVKSLVPRYVRIMLVQRDIPTQVTEAGVDRNNLRQYIYKALQEKHIKCSCIRCREIGHKLKKEKIKINPKDIKLNIIEYDASDGKEFFISFDDMKNDALIGFCRLRFPSENLRKEITKNSALIRELHVFGSAVEIGRKGEIQHAGYGKKLLKKAEQIAIKNKKHKMIVISGIGVRNYYRKLGYKTQGPYMIKKLK